MTTRKFKDFDKLFAGELDLTLSDDEAVEAREFVMWPFQLSGWEQHYVHRCVYYTKGHEDWQKFRVNLKGLSTQHKLYRLYRRYLDKVIAETNAMRRIEERCRIDNYIGALKRGGYLNDNLEIIK